MAGIIEGLARVCQTAGNGEIVTPLLLLQVPNTPNPREIGIALQTIFDQWSELDENAVAHVFGEHKSLEFGPYTIPYIEPQRVQNDKWCVC